MIFLFIVLGMTIYSFVQLLNGYVNVSLEENLLMICNVVCGVLLMMAGNQMLPEGQMGLAISTPRFVASQRYDTPSMAAPFVIPVPRRSFIVASPVGTL